MLLTRLTSVPFLMTLKQELMICHVALYDPALPCCTSPFSPWLSFSRSAFEGVELRVAIFLGIPCRLLSLVGVTGALIADAGCRSRRSHRWMRRIMTAVVEDLPRPSWSFSTKAVRSISVRMHRSRSSVISWNCKSASGLPYQGGVSDD